MFCIDRVAGLGQKRAPINVRFEAATANSARIQKTQRLMLRFAAQGVQALIIANDNCRRLLRGNALYGSFDILLGYVAAA